MRLYDHFLSENRPTPTAENSSDGAKWKLLNGGEADDTARPPHSQKESLTFS
jgi:hypothetical protein